MGWGLNHQKQWTSSCNHILHYFTALSKFDGIYRLVSPLSAKQQKTFRRLRRSKRRHMKQGWKLITSSRQQSSAFWHFDTLGCRKHTSVMSVQDSKSAGHLHTHTHRYICVELVSIVYIHHYLQKYLHIHTYIYIYIHT